MKCTNILISLVFMLIAPATLGQDESFETTWQAKKQAIADLSQGKTHYADSGPTDGDVIVMVHGVSGPMTCWEKNVPFLNAAGYRTLTYDLYGRGFSDRLDADHNLDLYIRQLDDLLADRKVTDEITLVGSSFGSVISGEFANRYPDRVARVILIGPAGFPIEVPFIAKLRDVPLLGDLLFWLAGESTIMEQNRKYFVDEEAWNAHKDYYEAQLKVPNSAKALLSTMRNSPVQSYVPRYQELGTKGVPVGVIWGRQDETFPYENAQVLQEAIPSATLITIENSAHLPQFERPDEVNPALLKLIREL